MNAQLDRLHFTPRPSGDFHVCAVVQGAPVQFSMARAAAVLALAELQQALEPASQPPSAETAGAWWCDACHGVMHGERRPEHCPHCGGAT